MQKNVAGKWIVFAFQDEGGANPGDPVTGDAANITANVRIDGAAADAVDDTNPTELEDGYYVFDLTATETNGELLLLAPASATANVSVIGVPGAVWTTPANFPDLSVTATTGRVDVAAIAGTAQTANDVGQDVNDILTDTGTTIPALFPTNFADLSVTATTGRVDVAAVGGTTQTALDINDILTDTAALDSRLTSARAGYLDNLNGHTAQTGDTYALANGATGFAAIDTVVDGIQSDLSNGTDGLGALKALIDGLQDISATDVNAQVVDVLKTDTISEMSQQAPPAAPTFEQAIMYIYMALRNKVDVTAALKEFHNDAGTVIWKKTLSDDGTTYTEAEGETGP